MSAYSLQRDLDESGAGGISDTMYAKYVSGPWGGFMRKLFKGPSTTNTTTTATTTETAAGGGDGSNKSHPSSSSGKKTSAGAGATTGGHGSDIIKSRSYLDHMKNKTSPGVAAAPPSTLGVATAVAKIKPRRHFATQYTWLPQLLVKGNYVNPSMDEGMSVGYVFVGYCLLLMIVVNNSDRYTLQWLSLTNPINSSPPNPPSPHPLFPPAAVNSDRFDRASNAVYAGIYETIPPEETFFEKARREKQAMEEGQGLGSSTNHLSAATLTQEQLKTHFQGRFGHNEYDTRTSGDNAGDSSDQEMGTKTVEWSGKDTLLPTLRSPSANSSSSSAKSLRLRNAQSNTTAPSASDALPAMPTMHTMGTKRRKMAR